MLGLGVEWFAFFQLLLDEGYQLLGCLVLEQRTLGLAHE